MKGHKVAVPIWAQLLMMTRGNVYQAMKLEDELTQEWYEYYQAYAEAMNRK